MNWKNVVEVVLMLFWIPGIFFYNSISMIKKKSGTFPGKGDMLRGRLGAITESFINSQTYKGDSAVEMGKVYIILGVISFIGCVFGAMGILSVMK